MAAQSYIVVPNTLITAAGHSAAKRLMVALLGYSMPRRKKKQQVFSTQKSYAQLKALSGIHSDTTLNLAIRQLMQAGFLKKTNHYSWSHERGRMERCRNAYTIDHSYIRYLCDHDGYTLVPRSLLSFRLTNAQFAVALLLYKLAGHRGVARPSLRTIASMLHLAKSTVCLALRQLRELQLFIRILRRYIGRHGGTGYRKNRYCATDSPFATAQKKQRPKIRILSNCPDPSGQFLFLQGGSPKNGEQELLTS